MIKRAFFGEGTLRVVAGVVFVVNTGSTQKFCGWRSIKGDARMTESFERGFAVPTGDRSGVYRFVTVGAIRHRRQDNRVVLAVGGLARLPNAHLRDRLTIRRLNAPK